jgi:hypothetical protein
VTEPEKLDEERQSAEAFAVVGELVMTSSLLDSQLNRVLVTMLDFGENPMIESVIATFDPVRKIEILKARASHMPKGDWRKNVGKYCDHVDAVFKQRNIACHTPPAFKDGVWTFKPFAAAKLFKKIDLIGKTVKPSTLEDFRVAIKTGERALGEGATLVENLLRANAKQNRRNAAKAAKQQQQV